MADKRISQLVDRGTVANNDVVPIVVSGAVTTNKATISSIQTFMQGNLDLGVTSVGITLGSSGTDVSVTGSPITTSGNITINIPTASATNRGLLSSADWTTFNNKQNAGSFVTLNTVQTITAQKSFTGGGSSDSVIISHGSGSGFALDAIKSGNGEVIRVLKTGGSGNAMTVIGGNFEAPTIVKTGGTSSQFLMADGSVNTNVLPSGAYLPLAGGTLTGALNGTSAVFSSNIGSSGGFMNAEFFQTNLAPATSGGVRLGTQVAIRARNVANTANIPLIESTAIDSVSIASGGANVGIGVTALTKLHLQGSSPNYILLTNTAADGVPNAIQGGIIGQARGFANNLSQMASILFRNDPVNWFRGEISFSTNPTDGTDPSIAPTERLRITSQGNVGIGTATPLNRLVVSNSGALGLEIDPTSSSGGIVSILTFNRSLGAYKPIQINSEDIRFQTGLVSEERMRITSDGFARLSASSGGIQFNGDTAAANALDDYEEGTWTPTTPSTGYTISNSSGNYTKIGRQVTVQCRVMFSAVNSLNNSVVDISGNPFTANAVYTGLCRENTSVGAAYVTHVTSNNTLQINSMDGVLLGSNRTIRINENYIFTITYFT